MSLRYFKGTHLVQLPCMYYTLSLLQTTLAENRSLGIYQRPKHI